MMSLKEALEAVHNDNIHDTAKLQKACRVLQMFRLFEEALIIELKIMAEELDQIKTEVLNRSKA